MCLRLEIKIRGYSLIELLVVLSVIILISLSAIPNLFGRDEREQLDNAAQQVRQLIINGHTRSQAPALAQDTMTAQVYQVSLESFNTAAVNRVAIGGSSTNTVSLSRGTLFCDSNDMPGSLTVISSYKLPRGLFISKVFPSNLQAGSEKMVFQFTVGQNGFRCGDIADPSIDSTAYSAITWLGENGSTQTAARYAVITIESNKINEKRYLAIDRTTAEVTIHKADPQSYFTPANDSLSPRWTNITTKITTSVICRDDGSNIILIFPRAKDRFGDPNSAGDTNLSVYYDIRWISNPGAGETVVPLVSRYFYDLAHDNVRYQFDTTALSTANQPSTVQIQINAFDDTGNYQSTADADPDDLSVRKANFSFNCGSLAVDDDDDEGANFDQEDEEDRYNACLPTQASLFDRLKRFIGMKLWSNAQAVSAAECFAENGGVQSL